MKAIEISNKTYLIRHWGRWYRVQKGGADWQKLQPIIDKKQVATIESAAASLKAAKPAAITQPPIDL